MKYTQRIIIAMLLSLVLLLATMPMIGCSESSISGITATKLAVTKVPAVDLDVYIYADQGVPTLVPRSLTGAPIDISVQSLSIWGIASSETEYTVAGALTFTDVADANAVFAQIPESAGIYTKLSERTIYVLHGSGASAESLKNAIDSNNFKNYDDVAALAEVSKLPEDEATKLGLVGIVKPGEAAINMVKQYLDESIGETIDSTLSTAKSKIIALGVFSSQPIDLAEMAQRVSDNTIWDMDLGIVVSVNSVYPGFIFSPIASQFISSQDIPEVKVGSLTAYKYSVNLGDGQSIPLYINVSGNHLFLTASGNDAYAQTLMTNIRR